ncbi:hypothetical protein E2P81_ATG04400 [Venturia nashicola]|uniref:Uncharacterized protein n=1 Tax=Venturia nashicola TaxID=86259 RepID=A0A4Z1PAT8_9PEZI|nr:hypothetical protein E6O75_ATG04503 [Venturia nashicola]TLD37588.1 hypothetical protein E2P81_ATG04400 [Venturia nashicola]
MEKKDEAILALQTSTQELRAEKLDLSRQVFEAREAAKYAEKHLKFQQKEVTRLVAEAKKTQESFGSRLALRKKAYEDALDNLRT